MSTETVLGSAEKFLADQGLPIPPAEPVEETPDAPPDKPQHETICAEELEKAGLTLPPRPSGLLALALQDLQKVEGDSRYVVEMESWHEPDSVRGVCVVCLAGAVLARTGRVSPDVQVYVDDGPQLAGSLVNQLSALDCFRTGDLRHALEFLGHDYTHFNLPQYIAIPDFHHEHDRFYATLRSLVTTLEAVGL